MTVSSTTARQTYIGDGSLATYPYNFRILDTGDLVLVKRNTTTGAETLLALTTDYTVTGAGSYSGGTFTLLAGVLPTGYELAAYRVLDLLQPTDLRNQGDFLAEVHERVFDRLVMIDQQLQDQINRSIRIPDSEAGGAALKLPAKEVRALQQLTFDTSGNPVASAPAAAAVSPAMQPVVAALSLTLARLALGISAAMNPVVTAASLAAARTAMGPWGDALVTATGGTTARTLAAMGGDVAHVLNFGAAVTTAAVQAAVNSLPNGGIVFIPNGTHSLGKITVTNSGVTVFCQSPSGCILVPELSPGEFLFDVNLSAGAGAVRPFFFRFTNGSIVGNTTTRPMSAFKLKHVYCGGVDNAFIKGVNKALYFSDSYWSKYENLWIEHYTLGVSAESAAYPGNQNNFKNVNFFDGNEDDNAVPFDLTYLNNCLLDTCTIGCSAAYKIDQMKCGSGNNFINLRFESIRSNAASVILVGSRNRFSGCHFSHQDGFGSAITPGTNYITVSGDNNVFENLPLSFYGNIITLAEGTKGNEVFFESSNVTILANFSDYGDNRLHFDGRDHSSNYETTSDFQVTNLWTRSIDIATVTKDGVTSAASTDDGPFNFGEVVKYDTPVGNCRFYFSLGSIAANETYAFSFWAKSVSGAQNITVQVDPQETPKVVTLSPTKWTRIYHAAAMQGGPFTRRAEVTLGGTSTGILFSAPQVVHLGAAVAGVLPPIYWGGYVPTMSVARKVRPNHINDRYTYGVPTYGNYHVGDKSWELNAAAGAAPGFMCVVAGNPGTWKAMANLAA